LGKSRRRLHSPRKQRPRLAGRASFVRRSATCRPTGASKVLIDRDPQESNGHHGLSFPPIVGRKIHHCDGCNVRLRRRKPAEWVSGLLGSKFFGSCVDHGELRKNEKNLFCIDCNLCFCKHCVTSSAHDYCLHRRLLQICKYVYRDVVRLHDIQQHLDCSLIQSSHENDFSSAASKKLNIRSIPTAMVECSKPHRGATTTEMN
ncbi:hypothetical protein Pfo_007047, partial [Paulownia fortunei]